jgi:two-component system sensor histidine kinase/response regulator
MNHPAAFVWCQTVSSTTLERFRSLGREIAESIPSPVIFVRDIDYPTIGGEKYTLVVSSDLFLLILANERANASLYEVRVSFDVATIARFLDRLRESYPSSAKLRSARATIALPLSPAAIGFQNRFLVKFLEILSGEPTGTDIDCPRISVCQPVEDALAQQVQQERLLNQVIARIRSSLELPKILEAVVREVREFLQVDRLLIYQFIRSREYPNSGKGRVISEARISDNVNSTLNLEAEDDCFSYIPQYQEKYRRGSIVAVDDAESTYSSSFCLAEFLRNHQVRSKLIAPIVVQEELWGLLIAHQCDEKRHWLEQEKKFLGHIGEHLSIAIYQSQLYARVQEQKNLFERRVIERTRELQDTLIAAEAANLSKSEFLNNMSHELLTPLTCIIGLSSTLQKCSKERNFLPEEKQHQYLKTIQDNGNKLLELINDLLTFSQLSAGKAVLEVKQFSLAYLCNHAIEILKSDADQKQIELVLELRLNNDENDFRADHDRLQQILLHLLKNAIKFTPESGRVILRVWKEAHQVIFQVEDTGIGIPERKIPILFEKFTQLDGSRKRRYGGMGLGLALTKQLVELHGGTIEVESTIGSGSLFTVRIPQQAQRKANPLLTERDASFNRHNRTLVLITDDEETATLICDLLMVARYQVIWLIDSVAALKKIEIVRPCILIVDRQMPHVYHLCQLVKKSPTTRASKVLILNETPETGLDFLSRNGIDDYLLKPIQPASLLDKIRYLTALYRSTEPEAIESGSGRGSEK